MEQSGGLTPQPLRPHGARLHAAAGERLTAFQETRTHAVIVAGMHRSGTSAMTAALSLCGLQAPRTPMPANEFNEDGFWESEPVKVVNDAILKEMDSAWDDVLASRPARVGRHSRAAVDTIKAVLADEFAVDRDFAIKDPRISVLFSPWREALEDLKLTPRLVVMVRNPLDVASSLHRRDGFPPAKSALLWLAHLIAIERDSRGVPRIFVSYDDLLSNWRQCMRRLEETLDLRLPRWTDHSEMEVDSLLSSGKRHYASDQAALESRADLPAWIAEAYDWALTAAAGGAPDSAALDRIAAAFHGAADVFAPTLSFERRRADLRTEAQAKAQASAPAQTPAALQVDLSLYSATQSEGFDEKSCTRLSVELTRAPQTVSLTTPLREQPLTALRIDPAEAPGQVLLHDLRVRSPDGALLWEWRGELDLFKPERGVAAISLGERTAALEFLDSDPQAELPVALGAWRQVVVELSLSAPDAAEIAYFRASRESERKFATLSDKLDAFGAELARSAEIHAAQLSSTVDRKIAALSDAETQISRALSEKVDRLSAEVQRALETLEQSRALAISAEAAADARAMQLSAYFERRIGALGDDLAALARASAQATDARLSETTAALARLEASAQATDARIAESTAALTRLEATQATANALTQDLAQTTEERDRVQAALDLGRQEIAALRSSTSWRLTAPMRTLKSGPAALARALWQTARKGRAAIRRRLNPKSYAADPADAGDHNEARLLAGSSLFDPDWYLATYSDIRAAGVDPLSHYLHHGGFEGRAPGPAFDSRWYLGQNPDVAAAGINPLVHYLVAGRKEARTPLPPERFAPAKLSEHARLLRGVRHWKHLTARTALALDAVLPRRVARRLRASAIANAPRAEDAPQEQSSSAHTATYEQLLANAQARGSEYVPLAPEPIAVTPRIRAIAFYLPQFHPIPENDAWWGKGFTEWTNVSKAAPQFVGHYQPRLPDELGFYDLRVPDVQRRQVELAKHYGIHGFCFHYYWFTGRKRLLERPLNQFVAAKDIDFPFCICWANENWTRRWDGLDQEILMEQRHEPQDDLQFIEDLAPLLRDPRYIRIDGRPLIIVYRVDILPRPLQTVQAWRDYCRANGLGDPYLVAAQTFGTTDPRPFGFDAAVEFPPHADYRPEEITRDVTRLNPRGEGRVYSYERVARREANAPFPDYTLFRGIIPSWDNEARKPGKGHAFDGATPTLYRAWLLEHCRKTDHRYPAADEKLVFINAWNEWAEGAYLEPDRRFGYGYLQATKEALSAFPKQEDTPGERPPLHVIVHAFYPEVFAEILDDLRRLDTPFSLCATCPPEQARAVRSAYERSGLSSPFALIEVENRGRDVLAFFEALRRLDIPSDAVILKVHTKKSTHREDGGDWRRAMLEQLMTPAIVERALDVFAQDDRLGLVAPGKYIAPITTYIGFNQNRIEALLKRGGWRGIDMKADVFAAGTMFFIRRKSLDPLLALNLTRDEYEDEAGQKDGTLAHALERMFALVVLREGQRMIDTDALFGGGEYSANTDFPFAVKTDYLYQARPND